MAQATVVLGLLLMTATSAWANEEDVILQVRGQIRDGSVDFDRADLLALPQISLSTATVVTDGTHRFTGFLMRDLLDQLGAQGDRVITTGLNDYAVDIPMQDFYDYDVIVAHSMDDVPLERADKGPLWIVYPRDDHLALQDIRYDYRWVWQLYHLDVQ